MSHPVTHTDARGRKVTLDAPPQRLVSLVPSLTELLAYLGLDDRVVGLTRFCIRPEGWKEKKAIVGGTKQVNVKRVRALAPDLALANREENIRADVEALEATMPVYVTEVPNLPSALAMIGAVGHLTDRIAKAEALTDEIKRRFSRLARTNFAPLRAAYLIWRDPYMAAGRGTFIHAIMQRGGFVNVFGNETRYPTVTPEEIAVAEAEVVLCSTEPFPFHQKDAFTDDLRTALDVPVEIVDGQLFSWYGPRLLETPAHLRALRTGEREKG